MAGFRTRRQIVTAAGSKIADAKASAFRLTSTDDAVYIDLDTSDGNEKLILGDGLPATGAVCIGNAGAY